VFMLQYMYTTSADTGVITPNGNGTVSGTTVGCGGGGHYDCLNDGVTQPTSPTTGTDYITWANNDTAFFLMDTIGDVNTVSAITVWYFHVEGGTNAVQTIGLYAANQSTVYAGPTAIPSRSSGQWDSVTFSGLSL